MHLPPPHSEYFNPWSPDGNPQSLPYRRVSIGRIVQDLTCLILLRVCYFSPGRQTPARRLFQRARIWTNRKLEEPRSGFTQKRTCARHTQQFPSHATLSCVLSVSSVNLSPSPLLRYQSSLLLSLSRCMTDGLRCYFRSRAA